MGKKNINFSYQHPKRRRTKNKTNFKPQPMVTINRISRVLEPKVPDDIDIDKLAEMYLLQGVRRGIGLIVMMPQQLMDAVTRGDMPTHVDTMLLLKQVKEGIESTHRAAIDALEKRQTDLESLVGYRSINEEEVVEAVEADQFVRIITIPENGGGGFCAELDPKHRGLGATKREALEQLAELLDVE